MRTRSAREDMPLKPQVVAAALNDVLADDAIISTDSGTITAWAARYIQMKRQQCSRALAIWRRWRQACRTPSRHRSPIQGVNRWRSWVTAASARMLMAEFATAVKYRLPIKVVIIKNNVLGMIKWEQMVFLGNPEYGVELQPIDFVQFAKACGGIGFRCEKPEDVRPALEAMMLADGPALCEAVVNPFEPPMPARVTAKQALHVAESLARGEPNRGRIALTLFRNKVSDLAGS